MIFDTLEAEAQSTWLSIFGTLPAIPEDGLGKGAIALLGPQEPGFWAHFKASSEYADHKPDPLDRWSKRVIGDLAQVTGGQALFPFGPPVRPFIGWALRSGRAWTAPVGLLVHDHAGLMVSYRGAVFFPDVEVQTPTETAPCETCKTKPCLSACPVGALSQNKYDIAACDTYLGTEVGQACMAQGCAVRRTCPLSLSYGRQSEQSAFHMRSFHR